MKQQDQEPTRLTAENFYDVFSTLSSISPQVKSVVFTPSETEVPGMRVEYLITGNKMQMHIWPAPKFPENTEATLKKVFAQIPPKNLVVDYVPEVSSWYVCVRSAGMPFSATLVERYVTRIAAEV